MKKSIAITLAIITVILTLSSCTKIERESYPLTINSTPIDGEIFKYFLDSSWNDPQAGGTKDGRITEATYKCIRYVAVNSTFAAYSLSLSDEEKETLTEKSSVLWNMFKDHYNKIGVSKSTFIKIKTSEEYIEKLRIAFFDKGGTDEISDTVLRGVLYENYVSFQYIKTPLKETDVYGKERDFTAEEIEKLNTLYNEGVNTTVKSLGIEKAYQKISEEFPLSEHSYETQVITREDHSFTSAFYDKIKALSEGDATIIQQDNDNSVYLVYKTNIITDPLIFAEKRSECLKTISEEPLQSKINIMCNAYQSVRNKEIVNQYYKEVSEKR